MMANRGGTSSPVNHCVFLETNLDTRLVVLVNNNETISDFKDKLCKEHKICFPEVGEINISAVKVKRRKHLYHLTGSMNLNMAFVGIQKGWYIYVDILKVDKGELDANQNSSVVEEKKNIANNSLLLDEETKNQTLGEGLETVLADKTTKKRKLKSSDGKRRHKKSSTAARYDVEESHELPEKVQGEVVAVSPQDDILKGAMGKDNEMDEKSVEDVVRDQMETDNLAANHLDPNSGLTTNPDTEKKERQKKSSKDDINLSIVSGNVDCADATSESLPISGRRNHGSPLAEERQKENEMGERIDVDVGSGEDIPNAADNIQTTNVEIDGDEAKTVKPTKRKKSKKAKTPGNEDKIRKKSSKKSKNKPSLKIVESQVLSVEVNNAMEEAPPINSPQDTDVLFTESDAADLKKSIEGGDNTEDSTEKILKEKADMGDNFGSTKKDQDQVTCGAKSEKEKKSLDLHPGKKEGTRDNSGSVEVAVNSKKEGVKKRKMKEDESKDLDVSTKTVLESSSDDDSDEISMFRMQGGNNVAGGTKMSLQDIVRRTSGYKNAYLKASQSQPEVIDDDESPAAPALASVPHTQPK